MPVDSCDCPVWILDGRDYDAVNNAHWGVDPGRVATSAKFLTDRVEFVAEGAELVRCECVVSQRECAGHQRCVEPGNAGEEFTVAR
jgi:hypothetical protein